MCVCVCVCVCSIIMQIDAQSEILRDLEFFEKRLWQFYLL